jgi:hypothetical protein
MRLETHQLNNSKSKQTYSFSKESRLPKLRVHKLDRFYNLPTTRSKRSCSFGYGEKSSMHLKTEGAPLGSYEISNFVDQIGKRKISFGYGRD